MLETHLEPDLLQNRFKAPGSEGKLLLWLKDVERTIDGVPEVNISRPFARSSLPL